MCQFVPKFFNSSFLQLRFTPHFAPPTPDLKHQLKKLLLTFFVFIY